MTRGRAASSYALLLLRLAIGGTLVYAAVPKLLHPSLFADSVANYRLLPAVLVAWAAVALPWLELLVGICLVLGVAVRASTLLAAAMFSVFAAAILSASVRGLDISCGCFTLAPAAAGRQTNELWLTALLAAASLAAVALSGARPMLCVPTLQPRGSWRRRAAAVAVAVVLSGVLVSATAATALRQTPGKGASSEARSPKAARDEGLLVLGRRDLLAAVFTDPFVQDHPSLRLTATKVMAPDQVVRRLLETAIRPDVMDCTLDQMPLLLSRGLVRPFESGRVAHWDSVTPGFCALGGVSDGDRTLLAPADATGIGIIYRTDQVSPAPTSFHDLLRLAYSGRSAVQDDVATGIRLGSLMLGWGRTATLSNRQLTAVRKLMRAPEPYFFAFYRDEQELEGLYRSGLLLISTGDAATAGRLKESGVPVAFVRPKEGLLLRVRGFALSSTARQTQDALSWLSYYLSPRAQALDGELWGRVVSTSPAGSQSISEGLRKGGLTLVTAPSSWSRWEAVWTEVVVRSGHG